MRIRSGVRCRAHATVVALVLTAACGRDAIDWRHDLDSADPLDRELAVRAYEIGECPLTVDSAAALIERMFDSMPGIGSRATAALSARSKSDSQVFVAVATAPLGTLPTAKLADEVLRIEALHLVVASERVDAAFELIARYPTAPTHARPAIAFALTRMGLVGLRALELAYERGVCREGPLFHDVLGKAILASNGVVSAQAVEFLGRIENGDTLGRLAIDYAVQRPDERTLPLLERMGERAAGDLQSFLAQLLRLAVAHETDPNFERTIRPAGLASARLLAVALESNSPELRVAAQRSLGLVDSTAARMYVLERLDATNGDLRAAIEDLCGRVTALDLPQVAALARDRDPGQRAKACRALLTLAPRHSAARHVLEELLADIDPRVAESARQALVSLHAR